MNKMRRIRPGRFALIIVVFGLLALTVNADPPPPSQQLQVIADGRSVTQNWDKKLDSTNGDTTAGREGCDSDRFTCLFGDTVVRDNETGLVWERSPQTNAREWFGIIFECTFRTVGGRRGWRPPSVYELVSLVDPGNSGGDPDLPPSHPFDPAAVLPFSYWSATTDPDTPTHAYFVSFGNSNVGLIDKTNGLHLWCVRGGHK